MMKIRLNLVFTVCNSSSTNGRGHDAETVKTICNHTDVDTHSLYGCLLASVDLSAAIVVCGVHMV